ncbi:MAG: transposase [Candidatus Paceibacterota bacterium]|jgi:REP element-mobilizing transposase RayT
MSYRKVPFVQEEFYHIYSRGNSKQKIFLDDQDRDRFLKLLYLCNSEKSIDFREDIVRKEIDAWDFDRGELIVSMGAWVLMSNHFHLYITINSLRKQGFRKGLKNEITEFMHKLLTSYSKYFNKKYKRTRGLFEGKFRSVHIENDNQAKYLFSYIHLNPIKLIDSKWKENGVKNTKKVKSFLEKYFWSSYLDYRGVVRSPNKILNTKVFPEYFKNINDFDSEINDWLELKDY